MEQSLCRLKEQTRSQALQLSRASIRGTGLEPPYGTYTLSNGLFSAPSLVISDGGGLGQRGGTVLTEDLSLTRPAGWGYSPPGPAFCDLSGGQLVVSNIQIRGRSVIHHSGGNVLHQGLLTLAGGFWDEQTPRQQFGPLQLSFTN